MATANPISDATSSDLRQTADLLIAVAAMGTEQLERLLTHVAEEMPGQDLLIATPDNLPTEPVAGLRIVAAPASANTYWTLTAADFVNAYQLAAEHQARAIVLLGPGSASLRPSALRGLAEAVLTTPTDLAVSWYDLPPRSGLVNSAILYPLTRALFASRVRFPLAIDLGLSLRMAQRMAGAGQRFTASNQSDAILWPTHEAMAAGFSIAEVDVGPRELPQPVQADINAILSQVTGSLFADIDAKAAFWQRSRPLPPARPIAASSASTDAADVAPMVEQFRLAYTNLQEIWSLVLPPQSLFGLKRLSLLDPAAFHVPDNLWARIVYDFLVAYRLRTINRGHLLGALIPLYLAWVASHINITASGTDPERHIEAVAAAFEADKPYLVSRWRWPDRFNP